ncbi:MAG: DnaJ domain-containing protein [Atopobiaceae bacterium]|jgi:DnaJ-class molecular chaperone|nr:DnaJ domain-containing protein [Atopobiaceae bacterium]MCI2173258.1 DnaJ domain-containing protein [Atopobiaceae bacterium]MCI2207253.1 DnaJ domain-containing protein [Atopobiaceae bacterium]
MASMNDKDYYAILGVDQNASTEEIRKAFQTKARKLHPDVNKEPDAEERFKEVSEAYAVLSDDDKRKRYDAMRSGSPFAYGGGGSSAPQGDPFGGADPFGWGFPFGGAQPRKKTSNRAYNPKAGSDVVYNLDLDNDSAKKGCRRGVTYQRYDRCSSCGGTGSVHTEHSKVCPTCGGTGHISVDLQSLFGVGVMNMVCPECEGTGRVVADPCGVCGGTGRVLSASEVIVDIPADSHDGDEIRIPGKGNAGTNGSSTGDFVCRVGVASERLDAKQSMGFQAIGFALPFLVFGAIANVLSSVALIVAVPLVFGLFIILRAGIGGHGRRWWRNALAAVLSGCSNGIIFALFIVMFVSCMGRAGSYGSVYGGTSMNTFRG